MYMTHGERDEVKIDFGKVVEEGVGDELDAPGRGDLRGRGLDGRDGDLGPRAAQHVDGDDGLHRLRPVRDRHKHLQHPPHTVREPRNTGHAMGWGKG